MSRPSRALLGLGERRPRAWPLYTSLRPVWSASTTSSLGAPKSRPATTESSLSQIPFVPSWLVGVMPCVLPEFLPLDGGGSLRPRRTRLKGPGALLEAEAVPFQSWMRGSDFAIGSGQSLFGSSLDGW
ncbi:hypothetical protein RchiOBHm_Chr5g0011721 [Rosa chinensis]|uniref:Uncharacterized protein n=1 Tax=Rosa chinensis TaxID=74649 RepID=A0A2P6Q518_ROSCH|nr:hypothetical protein RchiOBHm_Chr5g0011721 [Rosa chinensis]